MRRYGHVLAVLARYGFEDILFRVDARHDVPWRDKLFKREILAKLRHNDIAIQFEHRGLERMSSILDRSGNRLSFAVVIAALIIGSSVVFQSGVGPGVVGYPLAGIAGLLVASVLGLWLLVWIVRSGRL